MLLWINVFLFYQIVGSSVSIVYMAHMMGQNLIGFHKRSDKSEHPNRIMLRSLANGVLFSLAIMFPIVVIIYAVCRWYRETAQAYYEAKGVYDDK